MIGVDERSMLRAGPAFVTALAAAAAIGRPFGHLPSPGAVVRGLEERRLRVLMGTWLESVAAFLLIVFSVGLYSRIRRTEAATTPFGSLGLAGGTATSVLLLGRAAATAAAAERVGSEGASPETATHAIDFGNLLIGKMAPVTLALMTGATTMAARRSDLLPPWIVRAGATLTAGLLSPVNFVFVIGGLAWVAVVGWVLGRTQVVEAP